MKNKKSLVAIIGILAVAAIGFTIAYNSDLMSFNNNFGTGLYRTEVSDTFTSPLDWKPCDTTAKTIAVKNTGTIDVAVRVKLDQYWKSKTGGDLAMLVDSNDNPLTTINFASDYADYWQKSGDWYVYKTALAPNATTHALIQSVSLSCNANLVGETTYSADGKTGESGNGAYNGASFHVDADIQTIQYDAINEWN